MKYKKVIIGLLSIVVVGAGVYVGYDEYKKYAHKKMLEDKAQRIASLIELPNEPDFNDTVDAVRIFVHDNSVHKMDEEFWEHVYDYDAMLTKLYDHASGKTDHKPPLECSTRTEVMERILTAMGYKARPVSGFKFENENMGHTFLEVYDENEQRWVISDPDQNIFWRDIDTKKRIGLTQALSVPVDTIEPCYTKDKCKGDMPDNIYARITKEKYLDYFDLGSIIDRDNSERILIVNEQRFDIETPLIYKGKEQTFCDIWEKNCRYDIRYVEEK